MGEDLAHTLKIEADQQRRASREAGPETVSKAWLKFYQCATEAPYYYNHLSGEVSNTAPISSTFTTTMTPLSSSWLEGGKVLARLKAAVRLQALWRGMQVRHRAHHDTTETVLRHAMSEAKQTGDVGHLESAIKDAMARGLDDESGLYFDAGSLLHQLHDGHDIEARDS